MGLGHSGLGTQWDWDTMGLGHNGPGAQWDWDTIGPLHNGSGTQWACDTMGPVHSGGWDTMGPVQWDWDTMGLVQWDWDTLGRVHNGTGTQWAWHTVGLGHNGPTPPVSMMFVVSPFRCRYELVPLRDRNIGVGVSSMSARIGGILAPLILETASVMNVLPMLIFGGLSVTAATLAFLLPETAGRPLPQLLEDVDTGRSW